MRASTYRLFIVAFLLLVLPTLGAAQSDQLTLSDFEKLEAKVISVVDNCMAASVGLGSKERPENGSAVVISKDGLLLTAYHVVEGLPDNNMIVSFNDGTTAKAKKLGGVPKLDIAVAQIIDEGEYPFAEIGNMDDVQNGDWCISIAHAGGFQSDRTPPVRLGRVVHRYNSGGFLQMTSTLIGGDSGGPTFDVNGKVIGIHSNIGGSLTQNQACPISDFTKDDHWQRLLDGEVWGKPGEDRKKDKKKKDDDDKKSDDEKSEDEKESDKKDASEEDAEDDEESDKSQSEKTPEDDSRKVEAPKDQEEKSVQEDEKEKAEPDPKADPKQDGDAEKQELAEPEKSDEKADEKTTNKEQTDSKDKKSKQEEEKLYETSLDAFNESASKYNKSIVRFWRRGRMICSGVVLSRDGMIVTKSSELMSRNFEVELPNGELVSAKILKRVKENDLLFVKVDRIFDNPLDITQTEEAEKRVSNLPLGSIVVAVGYGGEPVAMGVKSVKVRNLMESGYAVLGVQLGNRQNDLTIKSVTPNSAAKKAGFQKGDKITKIGGEEITTLDELRKKLRTLKPNSRVPIEFERDGRVAASLVKLDSSNARNDKAAQNYPQGGRLSRKRVNFTDALQSDTPFSPQHVGGPLINIQGQLLGLNIARAGRIKSYTLPLKTVSKEVVAIQNEQRNRED